MEMIRNLSSLPTKKNLVNAYSVIIRTSLVDRLHGGSGNDMAISMTGKIIAGQNIKCAASGV